ncbi:D-erythronate dehydrogenase [Arthrobacter sp. JSM 101049]|uniref:D-erythronate dehydrogenase n=1 Tax=Arthrobacter sp. JSM 101049 TaxID=929097 RepID=UPI003562D489
MNIVVTGGGGFLGSRVIQLLLERKDRGEAGVDFEQIISLDLAECPVADSRVRSVAGDVADPNLLASVITAETTGIFHLAAVLSGGSEEDFDLAMKINVGGTQAILDAARTSGVKPRIVFSSSLAVFGGLMPEVVPESLAAQPGSTYGAVKAIGELLVNEYSRKGFVDGRVCRLPTISVRPGKPNSAASSFASGLIREPLNGIPSDCPVPVDTRMWLSSPDIAVGNLVHALEVDAGLLGPWRTLNLPGISVTVDQMLESLANVGGREARELVTLNLDARVMDIVCSWPGDFDVERPLRLGFAKDVDFDDVVRQYRDEYVD